MRLNIGIYPPFLDFVIERELTSVALTHDNIYTVEPVLTSVFMLEAHYIVLVAVLLRVYRISNLLHRWDQVVADPSSQCSLGCLLY